MLGGSGVLPPWYGTGLVYQNQRGMVPHHRFLQPLFRGERWGWCMSSFFCLFIPDFPVWALLRRDESLAGQPLVVFRSGCVIAASPAARRAEVRVGWTLARAQALVPGLIAVPSQAAFLSLAWDEALTEVYERTPLIESLRPGLLLAMPTQRETVSRAGISSEAGAVAALSYSWQAQAGVAPDRTTAELAAYVAAPGTVNKIELDGSATWLQQVPIAYLQRVGVSRDTIERLGWFGWHTLGQLQALTLAQLVAQFPEGRTIYRYVQAADTRPVTSYVPPPTISVHYGFEAPVEQPGAWENLLYHLVEQAHQQLAGRTAQMVTLRLEMASGAVGGRVGERCARRWLREPTSSIADLKAAVRQTCANLLQSSGQQVVREPASESGREPAQAITGVEVRLGALASPASTQHNLFMPPAPSLKSALRSLEARFPGVMQRIVALDAAVMQEAGTCLPEASFHFVPLSVADLAEPAPTQKLPPKPCLRRLKRNRSNKPKRATKPSPFKNAAPRRAS